MNHNRSWRVALCIIGMIVTVWCGVPLSSYGYESLSFHDTLYADGAGHFYALASNGQQTTVYYTDGEHLVPMGPAENITASEMVCTDGQVYLLLPFDGVLGLYAPSNGQTAFVDDVIPKSGCAAITADRTLYVVDERTPKIIRVYAHLYEPKAPISVPSAVQCLFLSPDSGRVCALTEQGVYCPDNGKMLACAVPKEPFSLNEGIACDAGGTVYAFDEAHGFQRLMTTDCTPLYQAGGYFYTYTDHTVWQLDDSGEPIASFTPTARPITAMAASGSHIAVLSGETFTLCHNTDFEPLAAPSSVPPESEPSPVILSVPAQESSLPVSDTPPVSTPPVTVSDSQPSSDTASTPLSSDPEPTVSQPKPTVSYPSAVQVTTDAYTLGEALLTDIPLGTTIAVLKQHLQYPSCTLTVRNHHGALVNSGQVGTGFLLRFSLDEQTFRDYHTIIRGDVSGEGNLNTNDLTLYAQFLTGKQSLNPYQQSAADMDADGQCTVADLYHLQRAYRS